jgi:UDP:flavonoid glycosyltransferase YjiC (YdhE family)
VQRSGARRILFYPLSNVLGHLSRTLALAEEIDAQGHDVHVVRDGS